MTDSFLLSRDELNNLLYVLDLLYALDDADRFFSHPRAADILRIWVRLNHARCDHTDERHPSFCLTAPERSVVIEALDGSCLDGIALRRKMRRLLDRIKADVPSSLSGPR